MSLGGTALRPEAQVYWCAGSTLPQCEENGLKSASIVFAAL
jgi:hypothetical protein